MDKVLTKEESVGFHLVPVIDHVDARCEANELGCGAQSANPEHHTCTFVRRSQQFISLLQLLSKLLLKLS